MSNPEIYLVRQAESEGEMCQVCGDAVTREDGVLVGSDGEVTCPSGARHGPAVPETLWWSNEGGWASLDQAIVYTPDERSEDHLPPGGEWVRFLADAHDTISIPALDLTGGHVLVGESGGRSAVYDARPNSLLPGFVTVETEHGSLLLDVDRTITFEVATAAGGTESEASGE